MRERETKKEEFTRRKKSFLAEIFKRVFGNLVSHTYTQYIHIHNVHTEKKREGGRCVEENKYGRESIERV